MGIDEVDSGRRQVRSTADRLDKRGGGGGWWGREVRRGGGGGEGGGGGGGWWKSEVEVATSTFHFHLDQGGRAELPLRPSNNHAKWKWNVASKFHFQLPLKLPLPLKRLPI